MKIYQGFSDKKLKPAPRVVAIGVFDGVHLGHQRILSRTLAYANKRRISPMVITFDPDPSRVLHPEVPHPILISLSHRLKFLSELGIREVIVVKFNRPVSQIPHDEFLKKFLLKRIGARRIVLGNDFCFGRYGSGNAEYLKRVSKQLSFEVDLVPPFKLLKKTVSSTAIRALIRKGDISLAGKMLGRPVSVYGTVVRGRGRGKKLGFPTANLNPHHETLPPDGVYAAFGFLGRLRLKGVVHIGIRPTFMDKERSLEVHFLNFKGDLYGKDLELFFVKRLRGVRRFKTPKELILTVKTDIRSARKVLD